MGWADKVSAAKHKQVFDSPAVADGMALAQARTWTMGYADVYQSPDSDLAPVLVFRHAGVPVVLGDEVWDRMQLGKELKLKDPTTGKPARRNPFINIKRADRFVSIWPDGGLDALIARGAIVLACNLALSGYVGIVAHKTGMSREDARKLVFDKMVPGVIVQPSGIFAVSRAQEAGAGFLRST
jgi:hypothetical protein